MAIPDTDQERISTYERIPLKWSSYVFAGAALPTCDLVKPTQAAEAVGAYRITTDYFGSDFRRVTTADRPGRYGAMVTIVPLADPALARRESVTLFRAETESPAASAVDEQGRPSTSSAQPGDPRDAALMKLAITSGDSPAGAQMRAAIADGLIDHLLSVRGAEQRWWHGLAASLGQTQPMTQTEYLPPGYDADASKRWPLVVFLHGYGISNT